MAPCPRGCCGSYKEHIQSLRLRATIPAPKKTVDHTDTAVATTTEHWHDRQDVHLAMDRPAFEMVKHRNEDGSISVTNKEHAA